MATFNMEIGTDYIEVWLTGLQENYAYIREYSLHVYKYNNTTTPAGLDMDTDYNLDEDNPSESPHLIVTGLTPGTHYTYEFLCYNSHDNLTYVSEEDDFWTAEEAPSGGTTGSVRYYFDGTRDRSEDQTYTGDSQDEILPSWYIYDYTGYEFSYCTYDGIEVDPDSWVDVSDGKILKIYYVTLSYTVSYNLGTGTGWLIQEGPLAQATPAGYSLDLFTSSDLLAYRNQSSSSGYLITFNANGGNTTKTQQRSNKITSYTHTGWNSNSAGGGAAYSFGEPYTPTANITLYPYFAKTVSYSKVKLPDATQCTRDGYILLGWSNSSTAKDWSYAPGADYPGDEATTLYAFWQEDSYQYTLNTADHVTIQSDATPSGSYAPGTTINLSASVAAGYSFKQWTSSNTSLVPHKTASVTSFSMPSGDIAMTPEVTLDTYTITLNLNDGSSETKVPYTVESEAMTIPEQAREGYTFLGWTGTDIETPELTITISKGSVGNRTYIANWQANHYTYTIQYYSTTGKKLKEESFTQAYDTQRTIEILAIDGYERSKTNHTIHWSDAQDKTIEISPYKPIEYTITINFNNQQQPPTIEKYTIEQSFSFDTIPTYPDNAFIGWSGSDITSLQRNIYIPIDTIGDKTYEANWQPFTVFHFTNYNNISETAPKLLKDLANPTGIAIHWYAPKGLMEQFIVLINNNCNTTLVLNEKQTLNDYNAIVKTLNESPEPAHYSGSIRPELMNKTADDFITVDDLLALENAFNNRKFIK